MNHVSLYTSRVLAEHLLFRCKGGLKGRFPFANRLTLRFDREMMEEVDGPSSEDRTRAASAVLAALGKHPGIKSCRLDGWEYLPQAAVFSLLEALPSLSCLELTNAYRVDLDALLVPAVTQLTSLQAYADHILIAPDVLRSAPVLTQLQELRLTGLQVNDQPADNELCAALGALTALTQLELVTFSAATRPGMVALRGIHNETLRGHPLARLAPSLAALSRLRILVISDPHLELRTSNALLGGLAGLGELQELVMPEARVREEGWRTLQALTSLTRLHLYSIELKGQSRASAPGSISWWRRLRLEDTCLPELASFMPLPGLTSFIGTLFMRYGDGPVPAKEFRGLDAVLACLGAVQEVRLWLELDCDIWPGLSRILGQLPGLQEVVVRARHPHPLSAPDLGCLLGAARRLRFLDIANSAIDDAGLQPLEELPSLTKVCLGVAQREGEVGHTPRAVERLAVALAARRVPCLIVAPHLLDVEVHALEAWQQQGAEEGGDPEGRGGVSVARALPPQVLLKAMLQASLAGGAAAAGGGGGAGGDAGGGWRASVVAQSLAGADRRGGAGGAAGFHGGGGGGGGVHAWSGVVEWSLVDPDEPLVIITNEAAEYFRRVDL